MELGAIIKTLDAKKPSLRLKEAEVYHVACVIAGRKFSDRTWRNWKSLQRADGTPLVVQYQEEISWGQAMVLMAIAFDRHNAHERKPLPSDEEIWWILQSPFPGKFMLQQEFFDALVTEQARVWYYSKELPGVFKQMGYRGVSTTSLYAKIGDLIKGREKHFPNHIEEYCRALNDFGIPKKQTERAA